MLQLDKKYDFFAFEKESMTFMSTPEQFGSRISSQLTEYAKVMKDAGIEPN